MRNFDIYDLVSALINEQEHELIITGSDLFDFCLEFENRGIGYDFSDLSLERFQRRFSSNGIYSENRIKITQTHSFSQEINILVSGSETLIDSKELKKLWKGKKK